LNLDKWSEELASSSTSPLSYPTQTLEFLKAAPGPVIVVDNTSDESLATSYPLFLSNGIHIVTPNKKGFSSNISLWRDIYGAAANGGNPKGGYIFHEATVGAGLPVLSTLKELVETGDRIKKIEGIFSGTMSFLFNSFAPLDGNNGGKGFAACVKEAQQLGYTVCCLCERFTRFETLTVHDRSRTPAMTSMASMWPESSPFLPASPDWRSSRRLRSPFSH